jgi:predicted DCC family thiol-disulfide oxidoreductase YuxK
MSLLPELRKPFLGWVCYDADCTFCGRLAATANGPLARRGFKLIPLQSRWLASRFELHAPYKEMALITTTGDYLGGIDALLWIARAFWWASPVILLAKIPGVNSGLRVLYRFIAAHRHCIGGRCTVSSHNHLRSTRWAPLVVLPTITLFAHAHLEPWVFMWFLALALYAGCKWLTWTTHLPTPAFSFRSIAYLFLWPGMDARRFFARSERPIPSMTEWIVAFSKMLLGAILIWGLAGRIRSGLIVGWTGLIGLVFLLHFGLFHLLALVWQSFGIRAEPIMNAPLRASSLSDFWSARWNRGFNQLVHDFVLKPLHRIFGLRATTLAVFTISGLIHDLVISVPAAAGYGRPTAYFLIQGAGVLLERSKVGKNLGLNSGLTGWCYTAVFTLLPLYLLFHPPFIQNVILPFLRTLRAL